MTKRQKEYKERLSYFNRVAGQLKRYQDIDTSKYLVGVTTAKGVDRALKQMRFDYERPKIEASVEAYERRQYERYREDLEKEYRIESERAEKDADLAKKLNEAFVSSICKTIDSISKHQIAKFEEDKLDGLVDNFANIKDLYISDKQEFEKIIKDMDSTYFGTQHFYPQLKIIESDYISKVKKTRAHFVKAYKVRVDVNVDSIKIPLISTKGLKNYTEDIAADYIKELPKGIDYIYAVPRMARYIEKSSEVISILLDFFSEEDIHVYSIDEAFVDLTTYLNYYKKTPIGLVEMVLATIKEKTGLFATAGIGPNFFLAKVALDIFAKKEPNGIATMTKDDIKTKLWPIKPLSKIWGIGPRMEARLNAIYNTISFPIYHYNKRYYHYLLMHYLLHNFIATKQLQLTPNQIKILKDFKSNRVIPASFYESLKSRYPHKYFTSTYKYEEAYKEMKQYE